MSFLNPRDFYFECSKGIFGNATTNIGEFSENHNGFSLNNTNGVALDIWGDPGGNLTWLQAPSSMEVLSSDANDNAAGTGARSLVVIGLDSNFLPISEVVALNGVTPVALSTQFLRINRGFTLTHGTYGGANIGNITVRVAGGGPTQAYFPAGYGRISMTHYTVPAGKRLFIRSYSFNAETGKPTDFEFRLQSSLALAPGVYGFAQRSNPVKGVQGFLSRNYIHQTPIPEGIDVWVMATPGTNNTKMFAEWDGVLTDA